MERTQRSLWFHANFMRLWAAQTVSLFGSQVGGGALRYTAILLLGATPWQLSMLNIAALLPGLLFGLGVGVIVDRLRQRPLLIAADIGRGVLLLAVPLVFLFGQLRLELLYLVAFVSGILTTVFDIGYRSLLPQIIEREALVEGNSKLGVSDSLAEIAGPPLGGLLVQLMSAPFVVMIDGVSFFVSAACLWFVRIAKPPQPAKHGIASSLREVAALLRSTPLLRALLGIAVTQGLAGGMIGPLYDLFLIRFLGLPPALVGLTIGVGGIAALVGGILADRVVKRFGSRRVLVVALLLSGINMLIPLASGPQYRVLAMVFLAQAADVALAIAAITALSLRQAATPHVMLGRVEAVFSVAITAALLVGSLLGGILGEATSPRFALGCGVVLLVGAVGWVVRD